MWKVLSHELPCLAPKDLESISGQLFGGRKRFLIMAQQGHHREKEESCNEDIAQIANGARAEASDGGAHEQSVS